MYRESVLGHVDIDYTLYGAFHIAEMGTNGAIMVFYFLFPTDGLLLHPRALHALVLIAHISLKASFSG